MLDIAQIEAGFAKWRGRNAEQEHFSLETAKKIATFINTHELPAIQERLQVNSETFEAFNIYNVRLPGALAYMKLAIDDYMAQTDEETPLSTNEQGFLDAININLTLLYNKTVIIFNPNATYREKTGTAWGTKNELNQLSANITSWLEGHALQSANQTNAKALCLSIYTVLQTVKITLDSLNLSALTLRALNIAIRIDERKANLTRLLTQTAGIIAAFPAPTAPINNEHLALEEDTSNDMLGQGAEEDADEEATRLEDEAIARDRALDRALIVPRAPEEAEEAEQIEAIEQQFLDSLLEEQEMDGALQALNLHATEEADLFFGPENQPAPAASLDEHFDAPILTILTEARPLLEKISLIKSILDVEYNGLTELLRQKNQVNVLTKHLKNAKKLIREIERNQPALNALNLVIANRDKIEALLEQITEPEREAWRRRVIELERQTTIIPATLKSAVRKCSDVASWVFRKYAPERLQQTVNYYIPASADEQHKAALRGLAENHIIALSGSFDEAGQVLTLGRLGILENEIDSTINQLAGEAPCIKILLKHATITKLTALCAANRTGNSLLTTYIDLINNIITTRNRLNDIRGLNTTIDTFISNHDSFLVAISLFLSHYLGSLFKTSSAERIDKARTMKKQAEKWQEDCQIELNKGVDTIRITPIISSAVKTEFLNQISSLLSERAPDEEPPVPAIAAPLVDDNPADIPMLREAPATLPMRAVRRQDTIISEFKTVRTLFSRFMPLPPQPPPPPAAEAYVRRVIVM